MEELRFDFGKKYVILDYKIKKLQQDSAAAASFSVDEETFVVTLNLFNEDNLKINEASFDLPLETLITAVDLDYENKKLVFHVVNGTPIECDISELIDVTTNLISTTWSELKDLRDAGELVPGQQYRITDYECTTVQENTQSAGHQFDIIVTADDVDKLNENARAVHSDRDVPIFKGITASIATVEGEAGDVLKRAFLQTLPEWLPAGFIYAWGTNADISDGDSVNFVYTQSDTPSAGDAVWREGDEYGVVVSRVEESYFANSKLEAWQLKYCLDNDANRFAWALDKTIKVIKCYENEVDVYIHIRCPEEDVDGKFAWAYTNVDEIRDLDSFSIAELLEDVDRGDLGFTSTEEIIPGETIFEYYGYSSPVIDYIKMAGKGVIYRMIDEFNNDCPYDFKNIQFKRKLTDGVYDQVSGYETWIYTFSCYDTDSTDILDATMVSGYLLNEINSETTFTSENKIKVYTLSGDEEYETEKLGLAWLNEIVFIERLDVSQLGQDYRYREPTHNNSFGSNCFNMTFGDKCKTNSFGPGSFSNVFGDNCSNNTFGDRCYGNTFGNGCRYNTFGDTCYYNNFDDGCSTNTFGNECYSNTFGNYCFNNTFGDSCFNNTFGDSCRFNTFGTNCQYLQISDESWTEKKYISVDSGVQGASSANRFDLYDSAILNKNYQVTFSKDAVGNYIMKWHNTLLTYTGKYKTSSTDAVWKDITPVETYE